LGKPVWESQPDNGLLSRLAPASCSLWISADLRHIHINQGHEYPEYEEYREPFATTIVTKTEKRVLLRANPSKGIWRDLHLLTNLSKASGNNAPLNLQCFHARSGLAEPVELWVGELIKAKDAKIEDCTESTFTVPHALFTDDGSRVYGAGVDFAEAISQKLYGAVKYCWTQFKADEAAPTAEAQRHYWHALDLAQRKLLQLAGNPESRNGQAAFGHPDAIDGWTQLVCKAAQDAYAAVCPSTTPRQLQAFAAGSKTLQKALFPKK
jgi:CRISPR system Cascade subunit CasA